MIEKKREILINGITVGKGNILPILLRAKYWQLQGYNITIFGDRRLKKETLTYQRIKDYKFIELKDCGLATTKFQFIFEALRRNLRALTYIKNVKDNYDFVHSISSMLDFVIFPYVLKLFDKKVKWVTVFDNIVPFSGPGNKFSRFLAWLFFQFSLVLLKKADMIFVISKDLRDFFIKQGFRKNRVVVSGNGLDTEIIKKAKKDKKYEVDALFVGRINEAKGIYDMLDVLELVKKKYPNFQLAIMGKGDMATENRYKKEIKDRRLERNIRFLGYMTELEKFNIIKSSKCFLFLSKSESFGIALLEAVCCGLPAFTYDLPPYRHIYKNNEIIVSKKNDCKAVAEKMVQLFEEKNFENKKGKLLINKYDWERIAKIEVNSFNSLIL